MLTMLPLLTVLVAGPALGLTFEFPSPTSQLFTNGGAPSCAGPLGMGGITQPGVCLNAGDGIEELLTFPQPTTFDEVHLVFTMTDATFPAFDPTFEVSFDGTVLGSYTLDDGNPNFDLLFQAPGIFTTDTLTIRITQTSPVRPGSGSYNWIPGGTVGFSVPEPGAGLLSVLGLVGLGCATRRRRREDKSAPTNLRGAA